MYLLFLNIELLNSYFLSINHKNYLQKTLIVCNINSVKFITL